jgi:hypothetical protein
VISTHTSKGFTSDRRGQTLQDYVIGISIFLLTTAFVVGFIPTLFTPFTAPVDASQTAQADRYAAEVLSEITQPDSMNTLDGAETDTFFATESNLNRIPTSAQSEINVTLVDGNGTVQHTMGPPYQGESTAAATRIVVPEPSYVGNHTCTATCRIEVRLW